MNIDFKYNIGDIIKKNIYYVDKPTMMEGEVVGQKALILKDALFIDYIVYFRSYGPEGKRITLSTKDISRSNVIAYA